MLLQKKNRKKYIFFSVLTLIILLAANTLFVVFSLPDEIKVIQGQSEKYNNSKVVNLVLDKNQTNIVANKDLTKISGFLGTQNTHLYKTKGSIKLFGILPIKRVNVDIIPDIKLVPSGEAIGVRIEAKGLLVVGLSSITSTNGEKFSPAANAGFEVGDTILKINNAVVEKERDIVDYLNCRKNKTDKVKMTIERGHIKQYIDVQPIISEEDNMYKIGLWVRDNIAGIGTMTFYDDQTNTFGALGHGITDIDSGVLVDIYKGSIIKSKIASIQKARKTAPGELVGIFYEGYNTYGVIDKNTRYGIYGRLEDTVVKDRLSPIPIGLSYQVKEGPAKILTTINSNKVEAYDIEIQKVVRQPNADSKSMLIKVTDPRLLEKTGGIVQGMSGSPIIQDGRLIGAVTHVLVNDPTRGYGIFIEWMLEEANKTNSDIFKSQINDKSIDKIKHVVGE
jgi:stage IV sporulation protein B